MKSTRKPKKNALNKKRKEEKHAKLRDQIIETKVLERVNKMDLKTFEEMLFAKYDNGKPVVADLIKKLARENRKGFRTLFGELADTIDYDQLNPHHDRNLLDHTLDTVINVPDIIPSVSPRTGTLVKVAALFHDIGKPETRAIKVKENPDGEKIETANYLGHAQKSAEMVGKILENLGYSERDIKKIEFLIENHDIFIGAEISPEKTDADKTKVSKILSRIYNKQNEKGVTLKISDFHALLALCKADATAQIEFVKDDKDGKNSRASKIANLENIEGVLEEALVLDLNSEIKKLESEKEEIKNGPAPKVKNGKVVNQKQIDLWEQSSEEDRTSKINTIDKKINNLQVDANKRLEKSDGKDYRTD
jgi:putative nucleotidyltransferase with HDIG domain